VHFYSNWVQKLLLFDLRLTPFLLVSVFLLHEENDNLSEDLNEIDEEVQSVGDEVGVSTTGLEDDDLSVKHDEPTENGQSKVDVKLEQKLGSEKDVEESKKDEGAKAREKRSSQVQILSIRSKESSGGEAGKDDGGEHQSGGNDGRIEEHRHVQERAQAEAGEEGESEQHSEAGGTVLAVVRSHEESQGKAKAEERQKDASSTEDVGEHVNVRSPRCGEHAHGERGVHILQVTPDARLELVVEGVNKVVQSWSNGVSHFQLFILVLG